MTNVSSERAPEGVVPNGAKAGPDFIVVNTVISKLLSVELVTVLIAILMASTIDAVSASAQAKRLAHVSVSKITQPPIGWVEFCARQPTECAGPTTAPRNLVLSTKVWMDLVHVNRWVNETIKPLTDLEHWGVIERWSYPDDGYGDCEDYVLLKRRILIQSGWPREALLVTVVRDKGDKAHAVLTVTTDKGDYILDNQNTDILLWSETGYHFLKRQSQFNSNIWVSLGDPQPVITTATSRNR